MNPEADEARHRLSGVDPWHTSKRSVGSSPEPLPELQSALLDLETLKQLFADISSCAELSEVIPKYKSSERVPDSSISLHDGFELLRGGQLWGLQLRYRFDGNDWWDTLMISRNGIRLVRIRHQP